MSYYFFYVYRKTLQETLRSIFCLPFKYRFRDMKRISTNISFFILTLSILNGCSYKENRELIRLDALLKTDALTALNQLQAIDPSQMNHPDLCYYYLLKASAIDRSYTGLKNEDVQLYISEKYYAKVRDFYNLARTEYYIAKCLYMRDSIQSAHVMIKKAEKHYKKTDQSDSHLGGLIYYQLGSSENNPEDIPTSKAYFEKSHEMLTKAKDSIAALYPLAEIIRLEGLQSNLSKAQGLATELLRQINSIKSIPVKQYTDIKSYILYVICDVYQRGTDIPKALDFTQKAIDAYRCTDFGIPFDLYYNMGRLYYKNHQIDSARYYYNLAIDTTLTPNTAYSLSNIYLELAMLEEEQGNLKTALNLKDKYFETQHIWYNIREKNSLVALERDYQKILQEKIFLKERFFKLIVVISSLSLFFIVVVIILFLYSQQRKQNKNIEKLSDNVQHVQWGFSAMKELVSKIYAIHETVNKILIKNQTPIKNPKLYNQLEDLFIEQRNESALRLFSTLTSFDEYFISNLKAKYPHLSSEDLTMAAMVCHRWTIAEISSAFQINEDTARKRRSRLKNKILGKEATLENFEAYLEEILSNKKKKSSSQIDLF